MAWRFLLAPEFSMVCPTSSRVTWGSGLLSGKPGYAQRPFFPSEAHFPKSKLSVLLLVSRQVLNWKLMPMDSMLGLHPTQ